MDALDITEWQCARTEPGAAADPAELTDRLHWFPAAAPGTVAQAMRAARLWDGISPLALDADDFWFRTQFPLRGEAVLEIGGLATIAEVFVDGERRLVSENMFLAHRLELSGRGEVALHIAFRSLHRWLAGKRGRARWRPRMIQPPSLRFARTTMLGRMPGWCPEVQPVGPWRPIVLRRDEPRITKLQVQRSLDGAEGIVRVKLAAEPTCGASVQIGEIRQQLREGQAVVRLPNVCRWWPHTHGEPHLYPASLTLGDRVIPLASIGFRSIELDRGDDGKGFALIVNGLRVFCRGACWTTADLVTLRSDREACRPLLELARDAGMNMIRVPGTMAYESDAFFALCNELGLMVWQDAMLANFDYPRDAAFQESLGAEITQFLRRTEANASLAVFCGGSEVMQQAAMLGQPPSVWNDGPHAGVVAELAASLRPDLPYVPNSPSCGAWPFLPNEGVAHYYGVGCFKLPLTDARRAGVRFTSETLGFANVPCAQTLHEALPVASTTHPAWKAATPHDAGVSWDFEDIRDHYLRTLFEADPTALRYEDFERYLDASRAVGCMVMETVFAEWRRVGSGCAGGLVYQLSDLRPGAGWGVIDGLGRPKPVWHALKRAFRPRALAITDEGLNGLDFHVLNDRPEPLKADLTVLCLRDGRVRVREAKRTVEVLAHGALRINSAELLPEFFDISYAYRFGPPFHSVTAAWLTEPGGAAFIADAYHFTRMRLPAREALGLQAEIAHTADGWLLHLSIDALAQFVHVHDANFRLEEEWFHLPPGLPRALRLVPLRAGVTDPPEGEVRALNLAGAVTYRGRA